MLLINLMRPVYAMLGTFRAAQFYLNSFFNSDYLPVIETPLGLIRGSRMTSDSGRKFQSFRGVPFAKAPVGRLRFQDPAEIGPWNGVLDATEEGPECLQFDVSYLKVKGVEDCLKLNIYTHSVNHKVDKRPVMIFFYAGAFTEGSGNGETYLYGPRYFLNRDVVLVTINYRLGPFGFLSTDDEVAPGNYGLLDQMMAIRWVKKYIEHFGGDPNLITLFGASAGSASVEYHLLSPRSQGLFQRAIMQSGSSLCFWASSRPKSNYTQQLASRLGCPTSSSRALIDCLRKTDPHQLVLATRRPHLTSIWPVMFGPRVDTEREVPFIPEAPADMLRKGEYQKVPTIIGFNQNEGATLIAELLYLGGIRMRRFQRRLNSTIALAFGLQFEADGQQRSLEAFQKYFGSLQQPTRNVQLLEKMVADSSFFVCGQESLKYHATHNPDVYAYFFTHRGSLTVPFLYGVPRSYVDLGVSHGDELLTLFEAPIFGKLLRKPADVRVSGLMLDYWTSFAKSGIPKSSGANSTWLTSTAEPVGYMNLNSNPTFVNSSYPFTERMPYWRQFFGC